MKIEELRPLLKKLDLRLTPRVRLANGGCVHMLRYRTDAHAHIPEDKRSRGLICFSKRALRRDKRYVIHVFAHEISHLENREENHGGKNFRNSVKRFDKELRA